MPNSYSLHSIHFPLARVACPCRFWAFFAGFNCVLSNVLDLPIFPVLFTGYVQQLFPSISTLWIVVLKFAALIVVVLFNIKGTAVELILCRQLAVFLAPSGSISALLTDFMVTLQAWILWPPHQPFAHS